MRGGSAEGSAWLSAAFQGVFFAVWMCASSVLIDHERWQHSVIVAAIIGPGYGLTMWWTSRGERRARASAVGGLSREQQCEVLRAAKTGKPPADVKLRASAAGLVRNRLSDHARHRTFAVVMFAVFTAISVAVAVSGEWWYLATAAGAAWATVWAWRYGDGLRRKLATLEPPPSSVPPAKSRV